MLALTLSLSLALTPNPTPDPDPDPTHNPNSLEEKTLILFSSDNGAPLGAPHGHCPPFYARLVSPCLPTNPDVTHLPCICIYPASTLHLPGASWDSQNKLRREVWQAAAPLPSPRPQGEGSSREELLWSRDPSRSYVGSENLPLRGDKGSTWEGGCKVPMFAQ